MKATKENGLSFTCWDDGTAWLSLFLCTDNCNGRPPKVVEFPKVIRENGKQYKVTKIRFGWYCAPHVKVRIPAGARLEKGQERCEYNVHKFDVETY